MRNTWKSLLVPVLVAPLFGGALTLEVANASSNPEAARRHAAVIVQTTMPAMRPRWMPRLVRRARATPSASGI